jgi:tripartite ATP-independent transporter DctP family solute receptor
MKKILMLLLSVAFATFIFAGGTSVVFAQKVLRLAETHPQDYPTTKGDYEFARLVKERTNGKIVIEVFHSKQLGEEKAVIEQVQLGAIDFTRVSISPVSAFARELDAFQLPYLYRDATHMWKVLDGPIGQEILKKLEAANFVGLGWFEAGSRNFYTKKPVKTVGDLKGMKIRVQQAPLMVGMVEALGAVATPLSFGEVYSALQTGVIDGAENNWPSYLSTSKIFHR